MWQSVDSDIFVRECLKYNIFIRMSNGIERQVSLKPVENPVILSLATCPVPHA